MSMPQTAIHDTPRVDVCERLVVAGFAQTYRSDGPIQIPAQWQRLAP